MPANAKGRVFDQHLAHNLNKLLGLTLDEFDFDTGHPLNRRSNKSGRADMSLIVVRFKRRRVRNHVLNIAKKQLHGKTQITEHLLPYTRDLIKLASDIVGPENVWTNECKVFARHSNGNTLKILSQDDILLLYSSLASSKSSPKTPETPANISNLTEYPALSPSLELETQPCTSQTDPEYCTLIDIINKKNQSAPKTYADMNNRPFGKRKY